MKKLFIILLSALSLTTFAGDSDNILLPQWFLKPSAHTFVGISEPNGNVHDAINMALIHYLICSDFLGKMSMTSLTQSSINTLESSSKDLCQLDTTLRYSIEEIVSISNNEYICRISDRPTLSRRIIIQYYSDSHSLTTDDQDDFNMELSIKCFFEDHNGKSAKQIRIIISAQNGNVMEYDYSSQYMQGDVFELSYHNVENKEALGEQLITQYMHYLTNGFTPIQEGEKKAYHKATPFSGFEYKQGYITIIP